MKSKVFVFSVLLNFVFLVFAIASCSDAYKERRFREQEMRARLEAEEEKDKFMKEKQGVQEQIESLRKQLEEEKIDHDLTKKALLQEQIVTKGVKAELDKVGKPGDKP